MNNMDDLVEKVVNWGRDKNLNDAPRQLNKVIEDRLKILIKMEMRCIPVSNLQSLVAKLSGVAMMLASLHFYL